MTPITTIAREVIAADEKRTQPTPWTTEVHGVGRERSVVILDENYMAVADCGDDDIQPAVICTAVNNAKALASAVLRYEKLHEAVKAWHARMSAAHYGRPADFAADEAVCQALRRAVEDLFSEAQP